MVILKIQEGVVIVLMVGYIEPKDLAEKLRESTEKILVVDVRDHDYLVGKVKGSLRVPYCDFQHFIPELTNISDKFDSIVFHCHYSAQRGPSAAQMFEDFRVYSAEGPKVLVLRGGFSKWKSLYRADSDLFEPLEQ